MAGVGSVSRPRQDAQEWARRAESGHRLAHNVTGAFDSDCRRAGQPGIECYKNPIESQGIAATMSSEITSAPIYGQMRHSESSGLVRPIAQALKKPTPKGGAKRPIPIARITTIA